MHMDRRNSYAAREAQDMTPDGVPATEEVPAMPLAVGDCGVDASPLEDNGDANGYEEGYSTPTSPRSRLRAPDVCPGAPRLRTEGGPRRRKRKRTEHSGAVLIPGGRRLFPPTYTGGVIVEKLSHLYM